MSDVRGVLCQTYGRCYVRRAGGVTCHQEASPWVGVCGFNTNPMCVEIAFGGNPAPHPPSSGHTACNLQLPRNSGVGCLTPGGGLSDIPPATTHVHHPRPPTPRLRPHTERTHRTHTHKQHTLFLSDSSRLNSTSRTQMR